MKDVPKSFNVTLLNDDGKVKPCSTVYSSKGIGEPGMLMCANILSAIRQAVAAHRKVYSFLFYHDPSKSDYNNYLFNLKN